MFNRTFLYLGPALQTNTPFYSTLLRMFSKKLSINTYIEDTQHILYGKKESKDLLYVEANEVALSFFKDDIEDILEDYYYNSSNTVVLVVKINLKNKNWKKKFIEGKYSEIYTEEEIKKFAKKIAYTYETKLLLGHRFDVLTKNPDYWEEFYKVLSHRYKGLTYFPYDGRELDFPPKIEIENEILNYNYDTVFNDDSS